MSVFTPSGEYIRHIGGRQGRNEGELDQPWGVAIDSNNVMYVSEWKNNWISMFTQDGEFIQCFCTESKLGNFHGPFGLALDNNGKLYITNYQGNSLQVF